MLNMHSPNITDLESLYHRIGFLLQEHGNLALSVSVLQEGDSPFNCHYEDRSLAEHIEVVETEGKKFVELYV